MDLKLKINVLSFNSFMIKLTFLFVKSVNMSPKIAGYVILFLSFAATPSSYADNFERKWIFETNDFSATNTVQAQPKEHLGKLLLVDLTGNLIALNKTTGKLIYKKFLGAGAGRRGFTVNQETAEILIVANRRLFTLDVDTGKVLRSSKSVSSVTAPIITDICYIVLGNLGEIQCHNKNLDGVTWTKKLGKTARIWSNAAYSKKHDSVYFVTSNPGGLIFKKNRLDEYSSSLIAIRASTGEIVFSKRMIKNDVWDYDGVGKPIIVENYLQRNGVGLDIIIGTNKTGTIFVANAANGEDVKQAQFKTVNFAAEFDGPADIANSQIIPNWPNRVSETKIDQNNLRTEQLQKFKLRHARFEEFLRPSPHFDVIMRGIHGGPEWHGGIFYDDKVNNQKLIAYPTNNSAWILRVNYIRKNPIILKVGLVLASFANKAEEYLANQMVKLESFFSTKIESNTPVSRNIESRWSQDVWSNSDIKHRITNTYYKYFNNKSFNNSYRNYCASCHGFDRNGKYQSELYGDGFVPSLVGYTLTEKFSFAKDYKNLLEVHGNIPFPTEKEVNAIFSHFNELDTKLRDENKLKLKGFWQPLLGKDNLPLNKAPWGSVKIVDLNTGDLKGSVVVGKSQDALGKNVESSIIFGGLGEPTTKGNTMLTGTVDSSAYYISLSDQRVEAIVDLKRSGSVNPYLTKIDNCEAWVFVETGGRFSFYDRNNNGFTVEAFVNKDNCS
jgi:glucose dehydrogenase